MGESLASSFPLLFSPLQIQSLKLPNRIVHEPTDISSSNPDGSVSEHDIRHFETIAKGGAGLIIVGATTPDTKTGRPTVNCMAADSDAFIPGLARLAQAMHRYGAKCLVQLQHPGPKSSLPKTGMITTNDRVSKIFWGSGREVVYAGAEEKGTVARGMTTEEVLDMIQLFSEASFRIKQSGFDGVQLHAAHGYLISDFMSPYLNKRSDRFGGSFENRMRFPLAIIESIRRKCGNDFFISVRYNSIEFTDGGRDLAECIKVAEEFEKAGVACLDLSTSGVPSVGLDPMPVFEGWTLDIVRAVKQAVHIPVIASHTLRNPEFCEAALAEGKTDLIGLSRQLLADPFWPLKAYTGVQARIRKCISCLEGCWQESILAKKGISCTINPACGNYEAGPAPTSGKPMNIAVAGAGPAGMEAARTLALRGHHVTIFEKKSEAGGAILGCCLVEGKEKMKWYADWLRSELKALAVPVRLGEEATPGTLKGFDMVVVATGALSVKPEIPGSGGAGVLSLEEVMVCPKITCEYHPQDGRKPARVGQTVLVWGDGYPATDTALHLARMGRKVYIVTPAVKFAQEMEVINRHTLLQLYECKSIPAVKSKPFSHKVELLEGRELVAIHEGFVELIDRNLKRSTLEADTIVCCNLEPDKTLAAGLEASGIAYVTVGDVVTPRNLHAAVHEGYAAGMSIERGNIKGPNHAWVDRLPPEIQTQISRTHRGGRDE